jgi:type IV pilus assembly protein PilQ
MKSAAILFFFLISFCGYTKAAAQDADQMQQKLNQKVSYLEFKDIDIKDVLRILARQHFLNIVVSSEVSGRISVSLSNVQVRDVLNTILESQGCHYLIKNDLILVKSFDRISHMETKNEIFQLNYLDAIELKEALLPILTSKGEMRVLDLVKTDKADQRRSDILLVKDLPENLAIIRSVIKELDVPQKQLLIEALLIETILGEDDKFGFDWPKNINVKMGGADPVNPGSVNLENGKAAYSGFPVRKEGIRLGILTVDELMFTLNVLAQDENAKLVSNPKVATLNNKKALLKIGTQIPIPEVNRGIGGDMITYKDKQVNVILEVIPRIEPGNKVNLIVHPLIEEIIGYTGPGDFPQPITSVREVQTTVSVSPGETVVIGGMVKENKTEIESKVWLLGDIPFLGELFTSRTEIVNKTDLLIFITPKILGE